MILFRSICPGCLPKRMLSAVAVAFAAIGAGLLTPEFVVEAQKADIQITPATPLKPPTLRDRLIVGLKALSKSDVAFIDAVVFQVNAGRLPQRLVDQTFFWARQRAVSPAGGRERRPIIYFRPAMTTIARRIRVDL